MRERYLRYIKTPPLRGAGALTLGRRPPADGLGGSPTGSNPLGNGSPDQPQFPAVRPSNSACVARKRLSPGMGSGKWLEAARGRSSPSHGEGGGPWGFWTFCSRPRARVMGFARPVADTLGQRCPGGPPCSRCRPLASASNIGSISLAATSLACIFARMCLAPCQR